jgi:hypothetical protein
MIVRALTVGTAKTEWINRRAELITDTSLLVLLVLLVILIGAPMMVRPRQVAGLRQCTETHDHLLSNVQWCGGGSASGCH